MDGDVLKDKGLNPHNIKRACLTGFGLRIGERATLEQSEEECSYGTLMQLEKKWTPVVGQQVVEVKELFSVLLSP